MLAIHIWHFLKLAENKILYCNVLLSRLIHFQQLHHGPPRLTSLSEQSVMESDRRLARWLALAAGQQANPLAFHKPS